MTSTAAFSRSPLLILVTTVAVAWTAPHQGQGGGGVGGGCLHISHAITSAGTNCKADPSGAYYEGDCWALLLQRGPCPYMHWLVLDMDTGRAWCLFQVCPDHEALLVGQCERLGQATSKKFCPPTQQLIITEYGDTQCECPLGMVYYAADKRCYHPYDQGPCQQGDILQVVFSGDKAAAECVASLCPNNEVALTLECEAATSDTPSKDFHCYKLATMGPCKQGFLGVDPLLQRVRCTGNLPYSILNIARFGCIPGSRRDRRGTCRKEFKFPRRG